MKQNNKNNSNNIDNLPSRKEIYKKINRNNKIKHRRIIYSILLSIILIIFYSIGIWGMILIKNTKNSINNTYSYVKIHQSRNVSKLLKEEKPFSILLLGTDTGDLGRKFKGRTDTIIIITVNPKKEMTSLTSIPRDTAVHIPGYNNTVDKINSAYTYGGVPLAIKTVQQTLQIPIDFYILVNMGGLTKIINNLNGVTVTPPLSFHYQNVTVTKGKKIKLNGKEALSYSRMRDQDPLGDYGRQFRQKQIITAIIKKTMSASSFKEYNKTLDVIKNYIRTNLSYNDMITIESYYKKAGKHIKNYVLQGHTKILYGLSYQVINIKEQQKISNKIRAQLGLKKSSYNFKKNSLLNIYNINNSNKQYNINEQNNINKQDSTTNQNINEQAQDNTNSQIINNKNNNQYYISE